MNRKEIKNIIKLARLYLVSSTLLFYTLGSVLAIVGGYHFSLMQFIFGFFIATTAIISMSYSNNYFDAEADRYNKPTLFSGGSTGLLENKQTYELLKPIALFFMGISILLSVIFIFAFSFNFEFLLFVVAGNLLGWYYAAPPLKFSYRGFGEIATVITAGLILPGFGYFVLSKTFDLLFITFVVPVMLYVLIFILNAEIPDFESDRKGKKNNLIIRKSTNFGLLVAGVCGIVALLYNIILSIFNVLSVLIDFKVIALLSLIPFTFVIMSLTPRLVSRFGRLRLVMNNLSSVLLVVLLNNGYLFYVAISR
jgi:1,4-dihydroxy-2-naphthoate octaprenyltransferase